MPASSLIERFRAVSARVPDHLIDNEGLAVAVLRFQLFAGLYFCSTSDKRFFVSSSDECRRKSATNEDFIKRLNATVTLAFRICVGMTHTGLRWYDPQGIGSNGSRGVNTSTNAIYCTLHHNLWWSRGI